MKLNPSPNPVEPRPGTAFDLERFVPYRLAVLSGAVSRAMARVYGRRFGIAIPEWRIIAVLARFAPLSANALCERAAMDKVQVSRALTRLNRRGLVRRLTDPGDRRRSSLSLTAAGRRIHRAIVPIARHAERALLDCLREDDRRDLDRMLEQLVVRAHELERKQDKDSAGPPAGERPGRLRD